VAAALILLVLLGIVVYAVHDLWMRRWERKHPGEPSGWFVQEWVRRMDAPISNEAHQKWWDEWHRTGVTPGVWIERNQVTATGWRE